MRVDAAAGERGTDFCQLISTNSERLGMGQQSGLFDLALKLVPTTVSFGKVGSTWPSNSGKHSITGAPFKS